MKIENQIRTIFVLCSNCKIHNAVVHEEIGQKLMDAVIKYQEGLHDEVVELLYPIRSKIIKIGGSHAQVSHGSLTDF